MSKTEDQVFQVAPNGTVSRAEDRLAAAERTLPRRKFFNDMPDKGLFAAVALIGFLGILFLKTNTFISADLIARHGCDNYDFVWSCLVPVASSADAA